MVPQGANAQFAIEPTPPWAPVSAASLGYNDTHLLRAAIMGPAQQVCTFRSRFVKEGGYAMARWPSSVCGKTRFHKDATMRIFLVSCPHGVPSREPYEHWQPLLLFVSDTANYSLFGSAVGAMQPHQGAPKRAVLYDTLIYASTGVEQLAITPAARALHQLVRATLLLLPFGSALVLGCAWRSCTVFGLAWIAACAAALASYVTFEYFVLATAFRPQWTNIRDAPRFPPDLVVFDAACFAVVLARWACLPSQPAKPKKRGSELL